MGQRMREPYRKGLANHPGPESGAEGASFWERILEKWYGQTTRIRVHAARAWTTTQGEIDYWTYPLFLAVDL